jgi:hypothetical protein
LEWIFPLNATAFLALSYLAWANKEPRELWRMAAFAAGLFLASAIARAVLRPRSSFAETDGLGERLQAGSYEASLTLAAVLAGLAIVGRVPGVWIGAGLAIEAELIYLTGVKLRSAFLRGLGMAGFVFSLGRLLIVDLTALEQSRVLGHAVWNWSPVALLHVALFYVNRVMGGTGVFSFAATALLAAVGAAELPQRAVGTAWLLYGFVLFEVGLRKRLMEFRVQAYVLAVLGAGATIALHAAGNAARPWLALACSLLAVYGQAQRIRRLGGEGLEVDEREGVEWVLAGASAVLAALLLWRTVGLEYLGLAWCLLAVALLELGLRQWPVRLRVFAYPAALLGAIGVLWTHADHFQRLPPTATWVSYFGAAVCALAMVARLTWRPQAAASPTERGLLRDALGLASTLWLAAAIWLVAPDAWVSLLWAAVGVAWLETGFALRLGSFRGLAHATLAGISLRILTVDVGDEANRWWIMSAAAAILYYVSWRLQCKKAPEKGGAVVHRAMATLLAAELMHLEFGSWDATGWALYGLALLGVGVYWGVRDLRWAGYALGFAATLAAASTLLDSNARWWGAALVASALYAEQFLAPRGSGGDALEAKVRPAISVLATGLVTWLLYERMPASYLTVACGAQGMVLLLAGFPLRERALRLQGLPLLLLCILKLFIYDLRKPLNPRKRPIISITKVLLDCQPGSRNHGGCREHLSGDVGGVGCQPNLVVDASKGLLMSRDASHDHSRPIRITATETPTALILEVDPRTKLELQNHRTELNADGSDAFSSDHNLFQTFEWLANNSEYEFVQPEETGDLTAAPLLGVRDEEGKIVQRWGFMAYEVRSPQDDLANTGRCKFVGAE